LISAAIVMKACSTLVAFFADVSRKGIPISSANACRVQQQAMNGKVVVRTHPQAQLRLQSR
jgi:hypothetical protein